MTPRRSRSTAGTVAALATMYVLASPACVPSPLVVDEQAGDAGSDADVCPSSDLDAATSAACVASASSLEGIAWKLPCGARSGFFCNAKPMTVVVVAMGGTPGVTYDVTLQFLGVVEEKAFTGGTNDGRYWQIGGTPAADPVTAFELDVSSPAATYYPNRMIDAPVPETHVIDFMATIPIAAGATLTLRADPIDGSEIQNRNAQSAPYTVPGATSVKQPYDGQFLEMHVVSVTH